MREADVQVQVSVVVLVVSSLFPAFLSPSCLSEGGGEAPFTHSLRVLCPQLEGAESTFSFIREKS